jgi:gluconokinase
VTRALVIMGVSGCGKSTVGYLLSQRLGWPFYDADHYHPAENLAKMTQQIPLTDADRLPWLELLADLIQEHIARGESLVLACSALKAHYRTLLQRGQPEVRFIYLKGSFDLIYDRMRSREGHYMKASLLQSQFDALEEPEDALIVSIDQPVDAIVDAIIEGLSLSPSEEGKEL